MADRDPGRRELADVVGVKMHGVSDPDAGREPANLGQKVYRPQTVRLDREALLVFHLQKMGMQPHIEPLRQRRQIGHQRPMHGIR